MLLVSVKFIIAVIITEAITELVTKSSFFKPLREWFFSKKDTKIFKWLHSLFDCGYCMSLWIAWAVSLFMFRNVNIVYSHVDWIWIGIVIHRLSNIQHLIIDKLTYLKEWLKLKSFIENLMPGQGQVDK
ncbi:MAG: hypothetical protein DRO67_08370 [Candidatus Asgardarchaeum californiense]|nr:MAG: hypothetical protein DRO67_08370 [Candidatus Asgardarchaeum californiense]